MADVDRDELEFLISQHFDGTLSAEESARLHAHLAADVGAQSLYDDHAKIDAALRSSREVLAIDEAWLSSQIAETIDEANARPIRLSRWSWTPMVAAAALLVGLTVGILALQDLTERPIVAVDATPKTNVSPRPAITDIAIASPSPAPAMGYANVSVGVPANLTPQIVTALYLSRDLSANKVHIQAAGQRAPDVFD